MRDGPSQARIGQIQDCSALTVLHSRPNSHDSFSAQVPEGTFVFVREIMAHLVQFAVIRAGVHGLGAASAPKAHGTVPSQRARSEPRRSRGASCRSAREEPRGRLFATSSTRAPAAT